MTKTQMKAICKPLGILVDHKWGNGFIVAALTEIDIANKLRPLGFMVKGIGIGFDYNRNLVSFYAEKS